MKTHDGVFATISSFINCWNDECVKTEQISNAIPADLWTREIIPGYRTLARLVWHLVHTPVEMLERVGIVIIGPKRNAPLPASGQPIIKEHKRVSESVASLIASQWNDKTLAQVDEMYGEQWTRSMTLTVLLHHLIHHRGQMTVLLRTAGQPVPGLYGPAKEEWQQFGMTPPEV